MKTAYLIALLLGLAACSSNKSNSPSEPAPAAAQLTSMSTTATLERRHTTGEPGDNYSAAAYSFQFGSHDPKITGNDYDVEYSSGSLRSIQVVDNLAGMLDLGAMSCADIPNPYEQTGVYPGKGHGNYPYKEDRKLDPEFWFEYSDAFKKLQDGPTVSEVKPLQGHCYVINKVTNTRRVLAVFHVSDVSPDSIALDEIEVIESQEFKD